MEKNILCHDCKIPAEIEGEKIKNGVVAVYEKEGKKLEVFKCNKCYSQSKKLANFQKCEVYSRVVGYIRPVDQWHSGKQKEFTERKEYKT